LKRLMEFLRSVLPADPTQVIFLAGVVCLFVAPRLRWWPSEIMVGPEVTRDSLAQLVQGLGVFFVLPIVFAAVTGYFVCFWPGNHPLRRILVLICLPAFAGLGLMFSRFLFLAAPPSSILESAGNLVASKLGWAWSLPWKLLTGFHFCLIGLLFVAIYTSRLAFGIAALPISLPGNAASAALDAESWNRVKILVWVLVGPLFLLSSLLTFLTMGLPIYFSSHVPAYIQSDWFPRFSSVIEALFVFGVIFWLAGKKDRQVIRNATRLPEPAYAGLALAIPIGLGLLLSTGQYLFDRAEWTAHNFGNMDPPRFSSYFTLPDPWLLLLFFPALFEEMIFRGLLQRRFIQRYGTYRGIFLVGIVWAAFHFASDFAFARVTDQGAILKLFSRIFTCLILSYVFGWLTLRTGSILPASIAHTFYNVLVFSNFGQPFVGKSTIQVALWGVLAYVLFCYWPVSVEDEQGASSVVAGPEPAV
jgi:membrane protease YdiL (CAAX protease family)